MQIVINTIEGTFVVPREKQAQLISWLQQNAVKLGQETVKEHTAPGYPGVQLINE